MPVQAAKRSAHMLEDKMAPADFEAGDGELVADPAEPVDNVPPCGDSVGMVVVAFEAADM